MNSSNSNSGAAHHERGTSEPSSVLTTEARNNSNIIINSNSNRNNNNNSEASSSASTDLRQLFGRHMSVDNLAAPPPRSNSSRSSSHHQHSRTSSRGASVDVSMFQQSWSTVNSSDGSSGVFGVAATSAASAAAAAAHPLQGGGRPGRSASFGAFGQYHSQNGGGGVVVDNHAPPSGRCVSAPVSNNNNNNHHNNNNNNAAGPSVDVYGVSSVIHDAARITDWDKVLQLCETMPEAAQYAGRDGWTALHHACNRRCPRPDVVEALIRAYPEALLQEEEKSWLPLHYACRFKAPREVVRLLLDMYPESGRVSVATKDSKGRRPLYYAVRYDAPPGVAGLLIAVDPLAVLEEDQNEESPLALVWDSWAEKLEGKRMVHSFLPGGSPEPEETPREERAALMRQRLLREPKLRKRWEQVNMLLKAAFGFPFEDDDDADKDSDDAEDFQDLSSSSGSSSDDADAAVAVAAVNGASEQQLDASSNKSSSSNKNNKRQEPQRVWRIVHATAAVKCHTSLFLLACALHPEQANELDESDLRRPDTIGVVRPPSPSSHQTALHLAASSNAGGEPGKTVVISLLSLWREAAQVADGIDGSLPLHLVVENPKKQDWPIHAAILYHFYPRAVQVSDFNGKLPLHRAAAGITHEDHGGDPERSVIIQLVRAFPQAASHVDATGCVPFHYVAMNAKLWDDEADTLLNSYRHALQMRAGRAWEDRLPIHMAAASTKSRESLLQRLVQLHPRGCSLEDRTGKLPLHLACEQGKEWSHGTRCIFEAFPNALRRPENNARGWLPLHMAAACPTASAALIAKIVRLYPEAADIPDSRGRYPLHLACSSGKRWLGGLKALFDASPVAIGTCDHRSLLPLHICALSYCKKEDSHETKTKAVPKVQEKKEMVTNKEEAAEMDIIFNLLRADPTTIQ